MSWLLPAAVIGSSLIGAGASLLGSRQQASAARDAADRSWDIFAQQREDFTPWREAGQRGLSRLEQLVNVPFEESPGYNFRFNEGVRALDRAAAARGMLGSGARLRALQRYGQGIASDEYANYMNRLAALAGIGQTATAQGAAAAVPLAQSALQAGMQAGTAAGGGTIGAANAAMGGVNNLIALYARGLWPGSNVPMPNPSAITFYPGQGGY